MRRSARVLNAFAPVSHTAVPSPLLYSLGLSYAAKLSPPFVPTPKGPLTSPPQPPRQGLAGHPSKLGKWVDRMTSLRAGRGEFALRKEGGWDDDVAEAVKFWGAGEDFFAILETGAYTHLALSDGVGGWIDHTDPALYAQALMHYYATFIESSPSAAPWDALQNAYEGVLTEPLVMAGSATAVGVSMGDTGKTRAVNLGDSGFTILRKGETVFESTSQQHYFNCPYQLSKIPESMKSDGMLTDTPRKADRLEFDLIPGDVLILYSDGLADNLPSSHIPQLSSAVLNNLDSPTNAHLSPTERTSEYARILADVLLAYSRNAMLRTGNEEGGKGWKTPFEVESMKEAERVNRSQGKVEMKGFKGGKVDDITVITAVVSERLV